MSLPHNRCAELLLVLSSLAALCSGANILDLMGCASPSHHIWHMALVNALAARGHNVTVLSTDRDPTPPANVTYVHMEGVYDLFYKEHDVNLVHKHNETALESVDTLWSYGLLSCEGALRSRGLQQLLAYPDAFRFDLVLYDYTLGPCLLGFLPKFAYPPLVGVTAFNNPAYTAELLGGHNYYAYVPYFSLPYEQRMSFWERVENVWLHAYEYYQHYHHFLPAIDAMARRVFGPSLPYVAHLERHIVLALVNTHPALDYAEPLPPSVIPVGGLQVRAPRPLPADIEAFIAAAARGAVLFALGTNVRSDQLDTDKQLALLEAFAHFPDYHILWKFESDDQLPASAIPANVMIRAWLPQNDILAHPAVRAFFTHAGTLSTHEATWHAVPMLAMPFFVDQVRTAQRSVRDGVAERVHYANVTAAEVVRKLRRVLEDDGMRERMRLRSRRFRDQPERPLERAVWWIEYVLRDPEAGHLRSPVRELGALAANLYDVALAVLVVVVAIAVAIAVFVGRWQERGSVRLAAKKLN